MRRGTTPPEVTPEMYRQIFEEHPVGALVLERLIQLFSKPAQLEGGIDAVIKTYHRMGEHGVVQHIVAQINRANGAQPLERENDAQS